MPEPRPKPKTDSAGGPNPEDQVQPAIYIIADYCCFNFAVMAVIHEDLACRSADNNVAELCISEAVLADQQIMSLSYVYLQISR